jgi:hypothetical protein
MDGLLLLTEAEGLLPPEASAGASTAAPSERTARCLQLIEEGSEQHTDPQENSYQQQMFNGGPWGSHPNRGGW